MIRYLFACLQVIAAFALTTFGLMQWQTEGFGVDGIWPFGDEPHLHPIHYLAVGIVLIPVSLWKIFSLGPRDFDHAR